MTLLGKHRNGFTLIELTFAMTLSAAMMLMLSTAWATLNRPTSSLIAWGQLFQEMEIAVNAISRDLGGCLPEYNNNGQMGGKWEGILYQCQKYTFLSTDYLRLTFYGSNPSSTADDWTVDYYVDDEHRLVRRCTHNGVATEFYAADNVESMTIADDPNNIANLRVTLTFQYPKYTEKGEDEPLSRTCILITKKSP